MSENCYKFSISISPQSPHAGGDARAPRTLRPSPAGASRRSARASARSLRVRARRLRFQAPAKGRPVACHSFPQRFSQRSNLMDRVEHSRNRTLHAVTEMNFGLHSASDGRLARHGRPRQGSTCLRTAINSQSPSARSLRMRAGTPAHPGLYAQAPPGLPGAQRGLQPAVSACGRDVCASRLRRRADRLPAIRSHSGSHKGRTWWTGLNTPGIARSTR